ncbi:porin [Segatella copri]|uniref:porin n=1 Tax=Segatella copri TaxID=165179 RepID=UPI00291632D4|nr:porin [Segatella copri]MDV3123114.1 porin [Segatella copri]
MRKLYISALLAMSSLSLFAQKSTWADNIRISGFAIAQYQWTNPKDNEANSFNLRMARLALDGKVAGDFYWKTQLQITGNTSTLASSPRVVDLFIEWQKYKAFNVKVGEFQVPFTFESPIHPVDVGFMDNGQAVLKFTGYSDRSGMHSSNGRDIGIMAEGDFLENANGRNLLHYGVSVVNGQGINLKDVDQRKNVVASFWVMPIEGMRIGVSGWEGSYARKGTWTDETSGEQKKGVRSLPQHRYAISGEYDSNGWTFRSEYIHSTGKAFAKTMTNTNDDSASDCNLSDNGNKADGFYALGIVPVLKNKVSLKARYDLYRNNGEWNSAQTFYEAGADYYFTKNLKFSAEYALVNNRTLSKHNYSLINTELSIKF